MVRLWPPRNAGNSFLQQPSVFVKFCTFLTCLIYLLVKSSLLQVWYPSPGADAFKQEDFLQVFKMLLLQSTVFFFYFKLCIIAGVSVSSSS